MLGKPLFSDQYTENQSKLGYARVLVEMELNGAFPENIVLEDENGGQFIQ